MQVPREGDVVEGLCDVQPGHARRLERNCERELLSMVYIGL